MFLRGRSSCSLQKGPLFVPSLRVCCCRDYFSVTTHLSARSFATSDPWASLINIVKTKNEDQKQREGKSTRSRTTQQKEAKKLETKAPKSINDNKPEPPKKTHTANNKPQQNTTPQPTILKLLSQQKVLSWQEYKEAASLPLDVEDSDSTAVPSKKKSFAEHLAEKYGPEKAARIQKRLKQQKRGPWQPSKRLLRSEMVELRKEKEANPELKITDLATKYGISYEAVERILRSKWQPPTEVAERQDKKKKEKKLQSIRSKKKAVGASS